ncbi:hypothetical protein E4634_10290 [Mangrovimicrobium sediminis]|uniref:Uncharacterized protein n=1 Tax=Mangrovimicrobium sediminis TaxID=2562682 RepID=A0A4Z0M1V3_9GAMM|nr:hypothetical protein [Haliea sp. SAOS-164]TGD73414.1 hypothetical protein E4634_10290 [Haliea sp. SAOS-164]
MDDHDTTRNYYSDAVGTPSDEAPDILATGHSDIDTLYVSMSKRHPEGYDADYLRWHSLDHRPEQQRLRTLRTSLRVVSTPACRTARAAGCDGYECVDHAMFYFFAGRDAGMKEFYDLAVALNQAGRSPFIMPPVNRGAYTLDGAQAAPRIRTGRDVLPWYPVRGLYLLLEEGAAPPLALPALDGVAGIYHATSFDCDLAGIAAGQKLTLLFLDEDPAATAGTLRPLLEARWAEGTARPLLAAPFHCVVPYEWDRYLP